MNSSALRNKTVSDISQKALENNLRGGKENMIIYEDDEFDGASSKELLYQKNKRVLKDLKKLR